MGYKMGCVANPVVFLHGKENKKSAKLLQILTSDESSISQACLIWVPQIFMGNLQGRSLASVIAPWWPIPKAAVVTLSQRTRIPTIIF